MTPREGDATEGCSQQKKRKRMQSREKRGRTAKKHRPSLLPIKPVPAAAAAVLAHGSAAGGDKTPLCFGEWITTLASLVSRTTR